VPAPSERSAEANRAESREPEVNQALTAQTPKVNETPSAPFWELPRQISALISRIYRDADRPATDRFHKVFAIATIIAFGLFVWAAVTEGLGVLCMGLIVAPCIGGAAAVGVNCFYLLGRSSPDEESGAFELSRRLRKNSRARRRPIDSHFGEETEVKHEDSPQQAVTINALPLPDDSPTVEPTEQVNTDVRPK